MKAFGLFRQKFPNAILQLVGAPFIEGEPIIEKWKRQNLLQQVILVGSVKHDKLIEYIDQATLFITPSLEETFGNTLLESIVRKVPVIGGINSGAVPYVLQYGEEVSFVTFLILTLFAVLRICMYKSARSQ